MRCRPSSLKLAPSQLRHVMALGNSWITTGLLVGILMGLIPLSLNQSQPRIFEDSSTVVYCSVVHHGSVVHWHFLQWPLLYLGYLNIFEINLICIHNEQVRND